MSDKIIAQVASLPAREESLERMVNTILPQVDMLFVALNSYDHVPAFLDNNKKIVHALMDNSLGDAAKFYDVDQRHGYVLTCDDDLYYPEGYVGYMVDGVKRHGGAVSLLGKQYDNRPIPSFRGGYTKLYRCLGSVSNDVVVDVCGTGAMAFHTDSIKISVDDFPEPNMADIWFAKAAYEQDVKLTVLAHPQRYVGHKKFPWRIWTHSFRAEYQTEIMNSFLK